jgi:2-methylcitrate dehydratase PrpD
MSEPTPEYTRELVQFLHVLTPQDLPAEVLDQGRYFLLDYLAVTIRGSREESAKAAQRMLRKAGGTGKSVVLATDQKSSPSLAAFANGTASHGIELDDTHSGGSIHLGTVMYSVALALADELDDIEPAAFLTAVVAGFEAAARISMAAQPQEQYALGFHPTATCGVFGAAITAAKLLQLSAEQTLNAVGIAGSMAAGSMEFLAEGAWTKRIHPGLAAQGGIQAALLASEGFVGPQRILEGRDGYLHGYSRRPIPERLTQALGETYEIMRTAVKPHSCCRYMQGPIDAVLQIMREELLQPDQIRKIEVAVLKAGWGLVADPPAKKYNPESVVDAQFSMPFGAAIAALTGAAGLDQFTLAEIRSPRVHQMMAKVTLVHDPRIEETYPREWPARVTIQTGGETGGASHERFVRFPKGDPENPLTWDEMAAKFHALTGAILPTAQRDDIIRRVRGDRFSGLTAVCSEAFEVGRP